MKQSGEKKTKPKQLRQATNDLKWVPFLIVFHFTTRVLNRLSSSRLSAPVQKKPEDGSEKWHNLSNKTLHKLGNSGIITYQALLFFLNNFSVIKGDEGAQIPKAVQNIGALVFIVLGLASVVCYYLAADRVSPITSSSNKPALWMILLAVIIGISVIPLILWNSPEEHIWAKLFVGTACQFAAGFVGWKAANLIPGPFSAGEDIRNG